MGLWLCAGLRYTLAAVRIPSTEAAAFRAFVGSALIAGLLLLPVCLFTGPGGGDLGGASPSYARMDVAYPGLATAQDRPDRGPQLLLLFLAGRLPEPEPGSFRPLEDSGPETSPGLLDFGGPSPRSPPADPRP